ncbi:tRNA isopentenyltransferase [Dentipellis sp. KUC8613]|nr:tRNA isopentenyltransferase [Dentipellis sp. KUC8613]
MSLSPLIAICGTTGVGKSKLAVDLALKLYQGSHPHGWHGARVINADSMQVYKGMDIITNKIPVSERQGIEHVLMGFKDPMEQYVVGEWVRDAMSEVAKAHERKQIPIIVGGTSYWIQHLIFPDRLATDPDHPTRTPDSTPSEGLAASLAQLPPELLHLFHALPSIPPTASEDPERAFSLYALLSALDPVVASRWHWRDTRKVLRNLVIMKDQGRRPSEILTEQSQRSARPRYRTLCFWLYAKPEVLNSRLDARVDDMISQGLLEEIRNLHQISVEVPASSASLQTSDGIKDEGQKPDYTLGIYQSIGYKEFHTYLKEPVPSDQAFTIAVEAMKLSTRKYAKRQVSWLRNKLLPEVHAANELVDTRDVVVYLLDATELGDKWGSEVCDNAASLTQDFLDNKPLPEPTSFSESAKTMLSVTSKPKDPTAVLQARRKTICTACTVNELQPVMIDESDRRAHERTRDHRRMVSKARKLLLQ